MSINVHTLRGNHIPELIIIIRLLLLTVTLLIGPTIQTDNHVTLSNDQIPVEMTKEVPVVTPISSDKPEISTNTSFEESETATPDVPPTTYEVATNHELTQLDDESHDLLSRLVTAESRGEPFEGQIAVAEVVLNRISSDEFPNSLYEVVYQVNQFEPVHNGMIDEPATEESRNAVDEALNNSNIAHNAVFFYNLQTAESRWLDQFPIITQIGNHTFK